MATKKAKIHTTIEKMRKRRNAEVMRRYNKGEIKADIARALGMSQQHVGQVIKNANKQKEGA